MTAIPTLELLPCPHCGGQAQLYGYDTAETDAWSIKCNNGACEARVDNRNSAWQARTAWNRRANATIAALVAENERLEEEKDVAETIRHQQDIILEQQALRIVRLEARLAAPPVPVPDWSSAPKWANYWAANAGRTMGWYEDRPIIITGDPYWSAQGRKLFATMLIDLPLGVDWRQTLQQRPQGVGE